jgi:hypothetical protein
MRRRTLTTAAATLGLAGLAMLGTLARSDDEPGPKPGEPKAQSKQGGFPDLVGGLKATPGCLGVETARTSSGKSVIFAWFANRKAVMAWYNSRMHQGVMDAAGGPSRKPLAEVPDDEPILAVASITPSDRPRVEGFDMPISQIAIELYRPLPGGTSIGGTFAPAALKIPGHVRHELTESDGPKP